MLLVRTSSIDASKLRSSVGFETPRQRLLYPSLLLRRGWTARLFESPIAPRLQLARHTCNDLAGLCTHWCRPHETIEAHFKQAGRCWTYRYRQIPTAQLTRRRLLQRRRHLEKDQNEEEVPWNGWIGFNCSPRTTTIATRAAESTSRCTAPTSSTIAISCTSPSSRNTRPSFSEFCCRSARRCSVKSRECCATTYCGERTSRQNFLCKSVASARLGPVPQSLYCHASRKVCLCCRSQASACCVFLQVRGLCKRRCDGRA